MSRAVRTYYRFFLAFYYFTLSNSAKLDEIRNISSQFVISAKQTTKLIETFYYFEVTTPPIYLGEGPHWDVPSQSLYFVDLLGQKILRQDYRSRCITFAYLSHGPVGAVVPVQNQPGKLLVACGQDLLLVTWDGNFNVTDPPYVKLATLEASSRDTRVNDGKCDQAGRFWIGTMANEKSGGFIAPFRGSLYNFDGISSPRKSLTGVSIGNGLAWNSRNDAMYYIDSTTKRIFRFDYDVKNGNLSNKTVIFYLPSHNISGIPDGMTIDTDDNIWVVAHDGYSILHIDPTNGKLLRVVKLPARRITSVAFGGPELDVLFVTSAYHGVNDTERKLRPYSGCVFAIRGLGVKGLPANNFVLKK